MESASRLHDLPERVLADDFVSAKRPKIAAAHLETVAVDCRPCERPLGRAALPRDKVAVVAVLHVRYPAETGAEALANFRQTDESATPRIGTARRFEDAFVHEQGHDGIEVVAVERVEHAYDHLVPLRLFRHSTLRSHATPHTFIAARAYTSAVFTRPSMLRFSPKSASGSPLDVP